LLVLGDRGLGGFSGLIVGSVAVHAAARARCPVLVIRGAEPTAGPVVAGIDGTERSDLALGFAFEESAQRAAELIALHVRDGTPGRSDDSDADGQRLTDALAGWQRKYPDVMVKPEMVRGDPRHELRKRSREAQLMVLGTHGRDTFKGLLLGSVSQTLLYHSGCPVAVVRATLPTRGVPSIPASGPSDNVDRFLDRPRNAVSGLVPDRQRTVQVLDALRTDLADSSDIMVLHGPEGVRILDTDGTRHGPHAKLVRFFQNWGYDDAVLNLYDEGLRKGESVVVIPSTPADKVAIARLLQRHQGHAIHYFGLRSAESLGRP
jgi:nucleotide-binding universal stress UspA family protein